jgi:acetyl esterase/lipase
MSYPIINAAPLSRRTFVHVGGLSALGLGLGQYFLLRQARADDAPRNIAATSGRATRPKAKNCILIWLDGGPSHLETFDLKPNAPQEVRGPFAPIETTVPGIQVCSLLPGLAARMKHAAIVRSMTSPLGEHNLGASYMLTGYVPTPALDYPAMGSVVAYLHEGDSPLPKHVAVPDFSVGGQTQVANGFLPQSARPFEVGGDPERPNFRVQNLDFYPSLDKGRMNRRREYLAALEDLRRGKDADAEPREEPLAQAYRLINSPQAKAAFDLNSESTETRARYGPRKIGQSVLLARRLVEAGVPFVTVNYPGWDTHDNVYTRLGEGFTNAKVPVGLIPSLDQALSGLLDDLADRRLLDETLVVVMGEFGRTPKLNTRGGRDHWPRVFSVLLAGGGVPGGQVIGLSDATGESPQDNPITPADLAATIFTLLGIDPQRELHTADGRPIRLSRDGRAIKQLVS